MPASRQRRLCSIADAAAFLSVSPKTVRRRIADGSLAAYRVGPRIVRVDLDDIDALIARVPAAGDTA